MERLTTTHRRCGTIAALVLTLAVLASLVAGNAAARPSARSLGWGYLVSLNIDHHVTWRTSADAGMNTTCRGTPVVVPLDNHGSFSLKGQSLKPALGASYIGVSPRRIKPGSLGIFGAGGLSTWTLDMQGVAITRWSQLSGCREPDSAYPTDGCGRIPNPFPHTPKGSRWEFGYNIGLGESRFPRDHIGFLVPRFDLRYQRCPGPGAPFGNVRWDKTSGKVAPKAFTQKRRFVIRHIDSRTFSCIRCGDWSNVDQGSIDYTLRSEWSLSFQPCKQYPVANGNIKCGGHIFGPGGRPLRPGSPPRR